MRTLRRLTLLVALLAVATLALAQTRPASPPAKPSVQAPVTPAPPPPPPPLATVNGSPITRDHVNKAIDSAWAAPMMRAIIEDRLIRQEARRRGIKVSPDEVAAAVKVERAKFLTDQAYQRHLQAQGLTAPGLSEKVARDLLVERLMSEQGSVGETEVRAYYEGHQAEFAGAKQVHLLAIVTTTVEDAYLARERLAGGDRFDVVAKELSVHETRDKGGDFGWLAPDSLPDKALAEAIFGLEQDVVSDPLRAGAGYWIALVRELKGQRTLSLEQARPAILEKLAAERRLSREVYLRQLARQADIQVPWAAASYLTEEYRRYREIQVLVDGRELVLDPAPQRLANGTIIVPAKPVLQAIGARVDWVAGEQALTATTPAGRLKLVVGSARALGGPDGKDVVDIKEAPVMRGGTLWIAPRLVLQALGARVEWRAAANALAIISPADSVPPPTVPASRGGLQEGP